MSNEERELLVKELTHLKETVKADFVSPKDIRRMDAIQSLLLSNGESETLTIKITKGRGGRLGMFTKKGYNKKGPIGY